MKKYPIFYLLLVICILLSSCSFLQAVPEDEVAGTLLVWHTWPKPNDALLTELFESYTAVNPHVTIVSEYVPAQELEKRFSEQVIAGLGPDIIIGAELNVIRNLIAKGHLTDLMPYNIDTEALLPQAVDALRIDDALYGLPIAAYTDVLYYNTAFVDAAPETLLELLEEAKTGQKIAIPTDFRDAYWGISAFNGKILDGNGAIVIDDGFVHWLSWLLRASEEPTIILNNNYPDLLQSFIDGEVAYLIGSSSDYPFLAESLPPDQLGLALLPRVQDQPGSFLELEVMTISQVTANETLSVELLSFLTNRTHQRLLALSGSGHIPVNHQVSFDSRLAPTAAVLQDQGEAAVIIPLAHVDVEDFLQEAGTEIFVQVLAGVLTPEDAAKQLSQEAADYNLATKHK